MTSQIRCIHSTTKLLVSGPPRQLPPDLSTLGAPPAPGKGRSRPGQAGTAVEAPKRLPLGEKPPSAQGGPRIQRMDPSVTNWLEKGDGLRYRHGRTGPNWIGNTPFPLNPTFKPPPPLSDALKTRIHSLNESDPHKYTPTKLSLDFKVSVDRIHALLRLKAVEKRWVDEGRTLQLEHLKGMEKHLGVASLNTKLKDDVAVMDLVSKTQQVDPEPAQVHPEPAAGVLPSNPRSSHKTSLAEQNIFLALDSNQAEEAKKSAEQYESTLEEKHKVAAEKPKKEADEGKGVTVKDNVEICPEINILHSCAAIIVMTMTKRVEKGVEEGADLPDEMYVCFISTHAIDASNEATMILSISTIFGRKCTARMWPVSRCERESAAGSPTEATEQLPAEVYRSGGLLNQVTRVQRENLANLEKDTLGYIRGRLDNTPPTHTSKLLYQLGNYGTDAQRLSEERVSIATSLRDIIARNIKLIETGIENQQTELQIGVRPGTQPSHNEQLKKERDSRLRSRAVREEQERAEKEKKEDDERYCFCHQVSFGDMVGCDNEQCPYQWFHLACIGLEDAPNGDFVCSFCQQQREVGESKDDDRENDENEDSQKNDVNDSSNTPATPNL
ncbi:hypothetical protein E3P92_03428 [Wallemia ichthyophaga]|nr:hypothetical protein E3P91_03445 [Wallemia ichthyophaga]TIA97158.1 hypothetical protein E3P94_03405 [Wallemia ichthyophaga]TIA97960.1 hypothetical protein E3P96_03284 [Wallemia ichthyophaga]TIB09564.1 hypothetical protein E3P92_03428 [Wallemia ichthyophaga]TIB29960.1 hypothetical protein E3P84_03506 [Wallemia ichthyophaga]